MEEPRRRAAPLQVAGVGDAVTVATSALRTVVPLIGWNGLLLGNTYMGILALDDVGSAEHPPESAIGTARMIDGVTGAQSLSVGQGGACVVRADPAGVVCWGCENGLSGNGGELLRRMELAEWTLRPSVVPGVDGAPVSVSIGQRHACAALSDGAPSRAGASTTVGRLGSRLSRARTGPSSPQTVGAWPE